MLASTLARRSIRGQRLFQHLQKGTANKQRTRLLIHTQARRILHKVQSILTSVEQASTSLGVNQNHSICSITGGYPMLYSILGLAVIWPCGSGRGLCQLGHQDAEQDPDGDGGARQLRPTLHSEHDEEYCQGVPKQQGLASSWIVLSWF